MNTSKLVVVALIFTQLSGCATKRLQNPDYYASHPDWQNSDTKKIALVKAKALTPPDIEIDFGLSRVQGASASIPMGALGGLGVWARGGQGCRGWVCGAWLLLMPVFAGGGAIAGGISGAIKGESPDTLAEGEASARSWLLPSYLQSKLIDHISAYAAENTSMQFIRVPEIDPANISENPDYAVLSEEGVDSVLELELARLSFEGGWFGQNIALRMVFRARIVSVDTNAVLNDVKYKFISEFHDFEEWLENSASKLAETIERGIRTIAENIVDEHFLLFYPKAPDKEDHHPRPSGPARWVPHYVLMPVYPELKSCFWCMKGKSERHLDFVEVENTQPTLRWEVFPREYDKTSSGGQRHRIDGVCYEVRIFEATEGPTHHFPSKLVYTKKGILEPQHMINLSLFPCTNYFWTVRAHFKLSGKERVTEWAGTFNRHSSRVLYLKPWNRRRSFKSDSSDLYDYGPERLYFPFRTPCK